MIGFRKSLYWVVVGILMVAFFALTGTPLIQTFYFICFLMPVVIITSYYFNQHLIPKYLLAGKPWHFALNTVYTIITALYSQAIILCLSLLLFTSLQADTLDNIAIDLLSLGLGTMLVILVNAFYQSIVKLKEQNNSIQKLKRASQLSKSSTITIKANRKNRQIRLDELQLIESRGDYVELITDSETIISKERISHLEKNLPNQFIRVHRSFIVNKMKIRTYTRNLINIADREIPISRSYKKVVLQKLDFDSVAKKNDP